VGGGAGTPLLVTGVALIKLVRQPHLLAYNYVKLIKIEYFVCFSSDFVKYSPPVRSKLIVVGEVLIQEYVLTVI